MKSLNQQINEIKDMKGSRQLKAQALFKLGLRKHEVTLIMSQLPKETKERMSFTFGVEIECLVPRYDIESIATRNGMPFRYEGYNHVDNDRYYKFVSDSSIRGANPIECVSPVLSGRNGMKSLEVCCRSLNDAGAQVNKSTGLHVHIGAKGLTPQQYANVFSNYFYLENVIDSFMAPSRRGNNNCYCRSLQDHCGLVDCVNPNGVSIELDNDRYHKVNPVSFVRHKTIEFRQHQGTTDFKKISMWVNFCAKLVAWSKKNRLTREIANIDEIPFINATEKKFFNRRREALL